jgi:hypothetical protein
MHRHPKRTDLFLVRVWTERTPEGGAAQGAEKASGGSGGSGDSDQVVYHGKVQRVVDGESHEFSSWQGLIDLLLTMLAMNERR